MKKIIKEYQFNEKELEIVNDLASKCGLLKETVKILYGRGVNTVEKIKKFIKPSRANFISPFKMQGMQEAVDLIAKAKENDWTVVVYGDYDADGICASTIMKCVLRDYGVQPHVFIPERKEGYGLNNQSIDLIFEKYHPNLFITVDCGISGYNEVEYIKSKGAIVLITDHHELPDILPDCICVNPKFNDGYIYDNLCGAGVAFKVGVALNGESAFDYLDFVTIATVADSVPLTGENRDIVAVGLKMINSNPNPVYSGFLSKQGDIDARDISFNIAPRINAAGRMGEAHLAFELFTSIDKQEIDKLCEKLCMLNIERQKYCDELYACAKKKLAESSEYGRVIMLWDEGWNAGFVGIVAARLVEEFSRPVVLFVRHGDMLKGSARSVDNINIFEGLKACEHLLGEYGGHAQAAGVSISLENFEKLKECLNNYLLEHYTPEDFEPTIYVCDKFESGYSERFAKELTLLEPYGVGNYKPLFVTDEKSLEVRPIKPQSTHINLIGGKLEMLYFGGIKYSYLLESNALKTYIFEYNISSYKGKDYVKGLVKDIIYSKTAGENCLQEIALNNILTLGCDQVENSKQYVTCDEIERMLLKSISCGTVYIASELSTLAKYKNISSLQVDLFTLSKGSGTDIVLLSPRYDVDLSLFKTIVFLDNSPLHTHIQSTRGREVIISKDIEGNNYLKNLPTERQELLKIFSYILANKENILGNDSADISLKNKFENFSPQHIGYALEVFKQLKLITIDDGKIVVYKGIKTELTNSTLYNTVKSL